MDSVMTWKKIVMVFVLSNIPAYCLMCFLYFNATLAMDAAIGNRQMVRYYARSMVNTIYFKLKPASYFAAADFDRSSDAALNRKLHLEIIKPDACLTCNSYRLDFKVSEPEVVKLIVKSSDGQPMNHMVCLRYLR